MSLWKIVNKIRIKIFNKTINLKMMIKKFYKVFILIFQGNVEGLSKEKSNMLFKRYLNGDNYMHVFFYLSQLKMVISKKKSHSSKALKSLISVKKLLMIIFLS